MSVVLAAVMAAVVYAHVGAYCLLVVLGLVRAGKGRPMDVAALAGDRAILAVGRVVAYTIWPFRAVLAAGIVGAVLGGDTLRSVAYTVALAVHLWAFRGPRGRWKRRARRVTARVRDAGGRLVVTPTPAAAA